MLSWLEAMEHATVLVNEWRPDAAARRRVRSNAMKDYRRRKRQMEEAQDAGATAWSIPSMQSGSLMPTERGPVAVHQLRRKESLSQRYAGELREVSMRMLLQSPQYRSGMLVVCGRCV